MAGHSILVFRYRHTKDQLNQVCEQLSEYELVTDLEVVEHATYLLDKSKGDASFQDWLIQQVQHHQATMVLVEMPIKYVDIPTLYSTLQQAGCYVFVLGNDEECPYHGLRYIAYDGDHYKAADTILEQAPFVMLQDYSWLRPVQIVIVDDIPSLTEDFQALLAQQAFVTNVHVIHVMKGGSKESVLASIEVAHPDIVLMDGNLHDGKNGYQGIDLAQALRQQEIGVFGFASSPSYAQLFNENGFETVVKHEHSNGHHMLRCLIRLLAHRALIGRFASHNVAILSYNRTVLNWGITAQIEMAYGLRILNFIHIIVPDNPDVSSMVHLITSSRSDLIVLDTSIETADTEVQGKFPKELLQALSKQGVGILCCAYDETPGTHHCSFSYLIPRLRLEKLNPRNLSREFGNACIKVILDKEFEK